MFEPWSCLYLPSIECVPFQEVFISISFWISRPEQSHSRVAVLMEFSVALSEYGSGLNAAFRKDPLGQGWHEHPLGCFARLDPHWRGAVPHDGRSIQARIASTGVCSRSSGPMRFVTPMPERSVL